MGATCEVCGDTEGVDVRDCGHWACENCSGESMCDDCVDLEEEEEDEKRCRVDMIVEARVDYTIPGEQRLCVATRKSTNLTTGEVYTSLANYWKERLSAPNPPTQD